MAVGTFTILAVGDVLVNRDEPESIFSHVKSVIREAEIAFCQIETNYSERGAPLPHSRVPMRAHPRNAYAMKDAGFGIVSLAGNHTMDWGTEAFLDTIEVMRKLGIDVIGAGKNIEDARLPKIVDHGGTRVAFLAYNSILPVGYWAELNKPGCVPLRALTCYEQIEMDQPGTPPRIHTFAHRDDKGAMIQDIKKARTQADIVLVSIHWGIHFTEAEISEYQKELGYAAIDAGADAILGHHAHILKPIEIYKRKPIFYSLGNFAFDLHLPESVLNSHKWREMMALNPSWTIDPRYKAYPFPADSRMTLGARLRISNNKIDKISFMPALINEDSQPRFLSQKDNEHQKILSYMERISHNQGIHTNYIVDGDEVAVSA